jgi:hypothetical protein
MVDLESATNGKQNYLCSLFKCQYVTPCDVRHPDDLMKPEIIGFCWPAVGCQVSWRSNENPPAHAKSPQLHRTVFDRTETKCDVRPVPNKIDAAVVQAQINPDIRVALLKREDKAADVPHAKRCRARNTYRSSRRASGAIRLVGGLLDEPDDVDGIGVKAIAFVSQGYVPRRAIEQADAKSLLQFAQMARDTRLGDAKFAGHR